MSKFFYILEFMMAVYKQEFFLEFMMFEYKWEFFLEFMISIFDIMKPYDIFNIDFGLFAYPYNGNENLIYNQKLIEFQ